MRMASPCQPVNENLWGYGHTVCSMAPEHIHRCICGPGWMSNEQKGFLMQGCSGTPEFIRKGYTLLGFYTEPDGGTRITEETDVPHEDTTLSRSLVRQ